MNRYKVVETQKRTGLAHSSKVSEPVIIEAKSMRAAMIQAKKIAEHDYESVRWENYEVRAILNDVNDCLEIELLPEELDPEEQEVVEEVVEVLRSKESTDPIIPLYRDEDEPAETLFSAVEIKSGNVMTAEWIEPKTFDVHTMRATIENTLGVGIVVHDTRISKGSAISEDRLSITQNEEYQYKAIDFSLESWEVYRDKEEAKEQEVTKSDVLEEVKTRIENSDLLESNGNVKIQANGIILVENYRNQPNGIYDPLTSLLETEEIEFVNDRSTHGCNVKLRLKNWEALKSLVVKKDETYLTEDGGIVVSAEDIMDMAEEDEPIGNTSEASENPVYPDNAVDTFKQIMEAAGLKVKSSKYGEGYYNNVAMLRHMKSGIWRLQLVGADPADYSEMETAKYEKKDTPHFDFCSVELDTRQILRDHINNVNK